MDGARPLALVLTLRTSLPVRFHTFLYGAFRYSSSAKPNEVDDPDAGQTRKGATQVPGTDTSKRCQSSVQLMNYNFELYNSPAIRLALFFQTPKIFQIMLDQSLNCWKKAGNSRYLLHYYQCCLSSRMQFFLGNQQNYTRSFFTSACCALTVSYMFHLYDDLGHQCSHHLCHLSNIVVSPVMASRQRRCCAWLSPITAVISSTLQYLLTAKLKFKDFFG